LEGRSCNVGGKKARSKTRVVGGKKKTRWKMREEGHYIRVWRVGICCKAGVEHSRSEREGTAAAAKGRKSKAASSVKHLRVCIKKRKQKELTVPL
jgi:hypothetical protein